MPSTAADWSLKCTNKRKINKLKKYLEILALVHKSIIEANWEEWAKNTGMLSKIYPELKIYDEIIKKYRDRDRLDKDYEKACTDYKEYLNVVSKIKNRKPLLDRVIVNYNGEIKGKILIHKNLLNIEMPPENVSKETTKVILDNDELLELIDNLGNPPKKIDYKQKQIDEQGNIDNYFSNRYIEVEHAILYGFQFRVYENRWPLSDEDIVSFVFAQIPGYPEFDGICVNIEDKIDAQRHFDSTRSKADFIISKPGLSLRYCNEDFVFKLLTWVNFFFFPEMSFDFGYGNNHRLDRKAIKPYIKNNLLLSKGLSELIEESFNEHKYSIGDSYNNGKPIIDKLFQKIINKEDLDSNRKFAERLLGKPDKIKATFKHKVSLRELNKISKMPEVVTPYFCQGCGIHFGLNLKNSIDTIHYIHKLRLLEHQQNGYFFDVDLEKYENNYFNDASVYKGLFFHAGSCGFCDSDENWIELRPIKNRINNN